MSYLGIGTAEPNHPLEVKGQVFISNVEQGSTTNLVPFEVYSDYSGITGDILNGARQMRLRATPSAATTSSNVNMDMGIEPTNGEYFYISNPAMDTPLGSNAAFRITQAGDISMGSNLSVTGSITSSTLNVGSVLDVNESNIIAYANVGIGTIDPQKPLHVMGNVLITGSLTTSSIIRTGDLPFTLTTPNLVNPVVTGTLSVSGALTSSTLDAETITSSSLTIGNILYVDGSAYTISKIANGNYRDNEAIIDTQGYLFVRGENFYGQLGLGYIGPPVPDFIRTALNITPKITDVAMGWEYTMIIAGGRVYGTGDNYYGQLGIGSSVFNTRKTTFTANATPVFASEIACGFGHTMIIGVDGTVSGTGRNRYGQLGIGNTADKPSFIRSNPVETASEIACGDEHTMIIDTNGTVSGTGYNLVGQLGIGNTADKPSFTRSNPVATASKIACGNYHSMIIDTNGTVSGTGDNYYGQLGIGFYEDKPSFIISNPVATASEIACGRAHTMIIGTNGTVSGTGDNYYGQLGIGSGTLKVNTFTANATPVTNASQISGGQDESTIVIDNNVYTTNNSGNFVGSKYPNRRVGIGSTKPGYQLDLFQNSAAKPISTFWTVASDRRIKEDIIDADLDTCLENVKNLKLRYYKLRDDIIELDPMLKDSHKLGWIAQEVEEILPKCVTTIPEQHGLLGVKNLDADQIYVNMFGTIQKLIKQNEDFRGRIEVLKNK